MEIERKYLVASLPDDLNRYPHVEIEQAYLCTSPTLRIRRMGDVHILTVKEKISTASSAIHNREEEFVLPKDTYNALKSKCDGQPVSKTRYKIPRGDYTAELEVFHGVHEGLHLVEVEFPDTNAADTFQPPAWFGVDVSTDPRYRNSYMAFNG